MSKGNLVFVLLMLVVEGGFRVGLKVAGLGSMPSVNLVDHTSI